MSKQDIYGRITDGAADEAIDKALRRMGSLGKTDEAEKADGPERSDSRDIKDLGVAKP